MRAVLLVRACRVGACRVGRVSGRAVFETPSACACRVSAMPVRVATQRAVPCCKSPCWRVRAVLDHLCLNLWVLNSAWLDFPDNLLAMGLLISGAYRTFNHCWHHPLQSRARIHDHMIQQCKQGTTRHPHSMKFSDSLGTAGVTFGLREGCPFPSPSGCFSFPALRAIPT